MTINERLRRMEKAFESELQAPDFHIYFIGNTTDSQKKMTPDVILSADGTRWLNPQRYSQE